MLKVLLMAFLVWNGQPIQPPVAMGLPDLEFTSEAECNAALELPEFSEAAGEMFGEFLRGKVPVGAGVVVMGKCLPADEAKAAMPKDESN